MRQLTMTEKNHIKSIYKKKKTTGEIDKISRTSNIDVNIYVFIFIFNFLDRICCSFFFLCSNNEMSKKVLIKKKNRNQNQFSFYESVLFSDKFNFTVSLSRCLFNVRPLHLIPKCKCSAIFSTPYKICFCCCYSEMHLLLYPF